jgi:ribonuclease HI
MSVNQRPSAKPGNLFGEPEPQNAPAARPGPRVIAHIDGGARGNPGPAGYGVFLQDEKGQVIARLHRYLGNQTNNFAEYSGLVAALEYASAHGLRSLQIYSDSELLVRQLKGIYKVNNLGLKPLYQRAQSLIRNLDHFRIDHVRREQNKEADRLANLAMDEKKQF